MALMEAYSTCFAVLGHPSERRNRSCFMLHLLTGLGSFGYFWMLDYVPYFRKRRASGPPGFAHSSAFLPLPPPVPTYLAGAPVPKTRPQHALNDRHLTAPISPCLVLREPTPLAYLRNAAGVSILHRRSRGGPALLLRRLRPFAVRGGRAVPPHSRELRGRVCLRERVPLRPCHKRNPAGTRSLRPLRRVPGVCVCVGFCWYRPRLPPDQ